MSPGAGRLVRLAQDFAWRVGGAVPPPLRRTWERLTFRAVQLGRAVQTALVTVLLVALYVGGIGPTRLLTVFFAPRLLAPFRPGPPADSYWRAAEGYDYDPRRLRGQI